MAAYLANQRVYVPFEMSMANGQPVIGYGYYPVAMGEGAPLVLNSETTFKVDQQ